MNNKGQLEIIKPLIKDLGLLLGDTYEVILHDLSQVESSIIAIQGNITNRKVGGPATDYLLSMLKRYGDDAPNDIHYPNKTADGKVLRSSTIFVKDENGKILGSLCINQDLTDYNIAQKLISDLIKINDEKPTNNVSETFSNEIHEVMENMVDKEIDNMGKPVTYMHKDDKLLLVNTLEAKGVFAIKNAVEYVAERLGVTNFTIYNYIKEIRAKNA